MLSSLLAGPAEDAARLITEAPVNTQQPVINRLQLGLKQPLASQKEHLVGTPTSTQIYIPGHWKFIGTKEQANDPSKYIWVPGVFETRPLNGTWHPPVWVTLHDGTFGLKNATWISKNPAYDSAAVRDPLQHK
jgi:hypothetical protein